MNGLKSIVYLRSSSVINTFYDRRNIFMQIHYRKSKSFYLMFLHQCSGNEDTVDETFLRKPDWIPK